MIKEIARKWWVKVGVQKMLSLLPFNLSLRLNELITAKLRGENRFQVGERFEKGLNNVELIRDKTKFEFKDRVILEVGTGWHGIDLLIFYLLGAKKIYTIDRYSYLTLSNFVKSINDLTNSYSKEELEEFGFLKERINCLLKILGQADGIQIKEFLSKLNISYLIKRPKQYKNIKFAESIDFFYSESVLQRIPEAHLTKLFRIVNEQMTDNGKFFHRTDQKDINSQTHVDNHLWPFQYLKYDKWVYEFFINSELNRQNRLRESDFLRKLSENKYRIQYVQSVFKERDLDLIKGINLSSDFKNYDNLDLSIRASKIIGEKGNRNSDFEREYITT